MPAGLRRALPVATVVVFLLTAPEVAFAGGGSGKPKCNASACKVYIEQGVPTAGGQSQPQISPSGGGSPSGGTGTPSSLPPKLRGLLQHAAPQDRAALSHILGTGAQRGLFQ